MYEYYAKILNVVDGDTFDLDIDLGFYIHIHERIRVLDLDTPEKRGNTEKESGLIVTEYAKRHFLGCDVKIKSKEEITAPKTDSFGRWLVEVILSDGRLIRDIYTQLGVNKYDKSYDPQKVLLLKDL